MLKVGELQQGGISTFPYFYIGIGTAILGWNSGVRDGKSPVERNFNVNIRNSD